MEEPDGGNLGELEAELQRVTTQLAQVESERREDLTYMQNANLKIAEKYQEQLAIFEEGSQEHELQVAALNRKVTALEDALSDSEEVQKRQAEKLEEAESTIQDLRGKVLSLESQEEDAGGQSVHMEAENMQLVARLREAETMVEEQREALNMASDMVEDLEAANAKLKKELEDEDGSESGYGSASASGDSALREAAERLKTEKKEMEDRIKELEGQEDHEILMAAQAELERLGIENRALQEQVQQLGGQVEELRRTNRELLADAGGEEKQEEQEESEQVEDHAAADAPAAHGLSEIGEAGAGEGVPGSKEGLAALTEEVEMLRLMKTSLEEDVERQQVEMEALRNEVERLRGLESGGANSDGQAVIIKQLQQELAEAQEHSMSQSIQAARLEQQKTMLEAELEAAQDAVLSAAQQTGRSASQALQDMQEAISAAALETNVGEEGRPLNPQAGDVELASLREMQARIVEALGRLAAQSDEVRSPVEATPFELGSMVLELLTVLIPGLIEEKVSLQAKLSELQLQRGAGSSSPAQPDEVQRLTAALEAKAAEADALAEDLLQKSRDIDELQRNYGQREAMAEGGVRGSEGAAAEDLQVEVKHLQAELEELRGARLELEAELAETTAALEDTGDKAAEIQQLRAEADGQRRAVAALKAKLSAIEEQGIVDSKSAEAQVTGGPAPGLAELKKQLEMQTTIVEALKAELRRSKQGEAGEHGFEHSLLSLEDSLQRLGATRASVVSEMNFDGKSGHADLLKELNRARATIAGLTLKQSDDLAIRCEAQQLAELRKEEIDALLENVTSQYTEISQLKGQVLKQQMSVQCEKERNEQLQRALGFHKAKVSSLEAVLLEHKDAASETAEMRQRLQETAELLEEKKRSLESIRKELSVGKKVWRDMSNLLQTDPAPKSQRSTWRATVSAPGSPIPAYNKDPHRPPRARAAWSVSGDTDDRMETRHSRKNRFHDEPQAPATPQEWLKRRPGVHRR